MNKDIQHQRTGALSAKRSCPAKCTAINLVVVLTLLGVALAQVASAWAEPTRLQGPPASTDIVTAVVKSPVTRDGDVAGHPTDINIILDRSLDPQVPGRTLLRGKTVKVILPLQFTRNPDVQVNSHDQGLLVLGWPQADVRSDYSVSLEAERTVVFTANEDILPTPGTPGIKVLHIRGKAFTNPPAGSYTVEVAAETGPAGEIEKGSGTLNVLPQIKPSINITNLLFGRPSNNNFQRVATNSDVPIPLDFLLFRADGQRDNGVGLAQADTTRYPKYRGGLIVRDTDGDGVLNPDKDTVIGGIIPAAPAGATGQRASAPTDTGAGKPQLSGTLINAQGSVVPGIIRVLFHTGDKPGIYQPTFELIDGTSVKVTVIAEGTSGATTPGMPRTGAGMQDLWFTVAAGGLLLLVAGLISRKDPSNRRANR